MNPTRSQSAFGNALDASPTSNVFATTSRARLPPELWALTVSTMRDRKSQAELAYLWITVRRVSKQFEWAVEKLFRAEHLWKTRIYADSGKASVLPPPTEAKFYHKVD